MINCSELSEIIQRYDKIQSTDCFKKVLSHFVYYGLIHADGTLPAKAKVSLEEVFEACQGEFRILELLPGIMVNAPEILDFAPSDVPEDLADLLARLEEGRELLPFRGIDVRGYQRWIINKRKFELVKQRSV